MDKTEIIFTDRNCMQEILDKTDLVTEMKKIRHCYATKGLLLWDGIER